MIAQAQYEDKNLAGNYNIGPDDADCWSTGDLVDLFCKEWKKQSGKECTWINKHDGGPHEANFLKLDCSKIKNKFSWKPTWNVAIAMEKIVEWSLCYANGENLCNCMDRQIKKFLEDGLRKNVSMVNE